MKVAIPLLNKEELAIDFSHSEFIGIFDTDKNAVELLKNQTLDLKLKTMELLKNLSPVGLAYTISPFYSYMTLRILKEIKIKTLKAKGTNLKDNIKSFKESQLHPFQVDESLLYGDCYRDCSGCGTSCSDN
jgi:predicted Fe-Mo cluster-binding NifX family protein